MDFFFFLLIICSWISENWYTSVEGSSPNNQLGIESFRNCSDLELPGTLYYFGAAFYNESVYIFGGIVSNSYVNLGIWKHKIRSDTCDEELANDGDTWQLLTIASGYFVLDGGNEHVTRKNFSDQFLMFGLRTAQGDGGLVWKFIFDNETLIEDTGLTVPNEAHYYCSAYDTTRNLVYIMGGLIPDSIDFIPSSKFLQIFDVDNDVFIENIENFGYTQLNNSKNGNFVGRTNGGCGYDAMNDEFYYFAGTTQDFVNSFEKSVLYYNINEHDWTELNNVFTNDLVDFGVAMLENQREAWIIGGNSNQVYENLIEIFHLDNKTAAIATDTSGDSIRISSRRYGGAVVVAQWPQVNETYYLDSDDINITNVTIEDVDNDYNLRILVLGGRTSANYKYESIVQISDTNIVTSTNDTTYLNYQNFNVEIDVLQSCDGLQLPGPGMAQVIYRPYDNSVYIFGIVTNVSDFIGLQSTYTDIDQFAYVWRKEINKDSDLCKNNNNNEWEIVNDEDYIQLLYLTENIYSIEEDRFYMFLSYILLIFSFDTFLFEVQLIEYPESVNPLWEDSTDYAQINQCIVMDEVNKNILYLLGGLSFHNGTDILDSDEVAQLSVVSNDYFLLAFDLDSLSFVLMTDIDTQYQSLSTFGIESRYDGSCVMDSQTNALYYFGGNKEYDYVSSAQTILKYSFDTHTWTEFGDLMTEDGDGATFGNAIKINSQVWIFGNENEIGSAASILVFDMETDDIYVDYNSNTSFENQMWLMTPMLYFDYYYNRTGIMVAGGAISKDGNAPKDSNATFVSFLWHEILANSTPSPTIEKQDILFEFLIDNNDNSLLTCDDISFENGITQSILTYFDATRDLQDYSYYNLNYSQSRFICLLGGWSPAEGDYLSTISCHEISNVTCDEFGSTQENDEKYQWQTLTNVEFEHQMHFRGWEYIQTDDYIVYIFNPSTGDTSLQGIYDSTVIKYDFLKETIDYIGYNDTNYIPKLNVESRAPCVCQNVNEYVYVLSYVPNSTISFNTNQFLHIFDKNNDSFVLSVNDEYLLPSSISNPRFGGSCKYDASLNTIFYFGGFEVMSYNYMDDELIYSETDSILTFNFDDNEWDIIKGVLDNQRYLSKVEQYNGVFYIMGGVENATLYDETYTTSYYPPTNYLNSILVYIPSTNESYISDVKLDKGMKSIGSVIIPMPNNTNYSVLVIASGTYIQSNWENELDTAYLSNFFDFRPGPVSSSINYIDISKAQDLFNAMSVKLWYFIIVVGLILITLCISELHNRGELDCCRCGCKQRKTDSVNNLAVLLYFGQLWDIWTDINVFGYILSLYLITKHEFHGYLLICAGVFVVIPWMLNMIAMFNLSKLLDIYTPYNKHAYKFAAQNSPKLLILCFLCGNFYTTLQLANCGIFGLPLYCMGMVQSEIQRFLSFKIIFTIFFENLGQIGVCIGIFLVNNIYFSETSNSSDIVGSVGLSFLMSVASVTNTLITYWKYFKIDLIEFNFSLDIEFNNYSTSNGQIKKTYPRGLQTISLKKTSCSKKLKQCMKIEDGVEINIRNIHVSGNKSTINAIVHQVQIVDNNCNKKCICGCDSTKRRTSITNNVDAVAMTQIVDNNSGKLKQKSTQTQTKTQSEISVSADLFREWKFVRPFQYRNNIKSIDFNEYKLLHLQISKLDELVCGFDGINDAIREFYFSRNKNDYINEIESIQLSVYKRNWNDIGYIKKWSKNENEIENENNSNNKNFLSLSQASTPGITPNMSNLHSQSSAGSGADTGTDTDGNDDIIIVGDIDNNNINKNNYNYNKNNQAIPIQGTHIIQQSTSQSKRYVD